VNQETRNRVILLAVLGVAFIGALIYAFNSSPGAARGKARKGGKNAKGGQEATQIATIAESVKTAFVTDTVDIDSLIEKIQDVKFNYAEVQQARNPMLPLVGSIPLESQKVNAADIGDKPDDDELIFIAQSMLLTGLLWDNDVPLAIINNEVVHEGYTFEDYGITVKSISDTNVVLLVPQTTGAIEHVLELKEPDTNE